MTFELLDEHTIFLVPDVDHGILISSGSKAPTKAKLLRLTLATAKDKIFRCSAKTTSNNIVALLLTVECSDRVAGLDFQQLDLATC
jgi:hypothetical protein